MSDRSVQVGEVRIPLIAVRKLTPQQRYVYYLLGLIHNEALTLRKLIVFAMGDLRDPRLYRRLPELSQALFLFRIGCCKLYEARMKLNSRVVRDILDNDVFPVWPEGREKQREMNKAAEAASWLYALRNQVGFHYPSLDDWKQFTTPDETWEDDVVYVGEEAGNQFFAAPEMVVRQQMFSTVQAESKQDQIRSWLEQAVAMLVLLSDFTEYAVGVFAINKLLDGMTPTATPLGKVAAPRMNDVRVPFWTLPMVRRRQKG